MVLYFLQRSLPWQVLKAPSRQEKYSPVFERKQTIKVTEMCHGLPTECATYMSYIRETDDQEKPSYKHLRDLFDRPFRRKGFEYDGVFDWTVQEFHGLSNVIQQQLASRANKAESERQRGCAGRYERKRTRQTGRRERRRMALEY